MKKIKFYDTSALLCANESIFSESFVISSITLQELENIKTSFNKDNETKYKARRVAHLLDENADKYEVVIYGKKQEKLLNKMPFADSNDARILACALSYSKDIVFITNDI